MRGPTPMGSGPPMDDRPGRTHVRSALEEAAHVDAWSDADVPLSRRAGTSFSLQPRGCKLVPTV